MWCHRWLEPIPAAQDTRWEPTLYRPFHRRAHSYSHPHSDWGNLNLQSPWVHIFGMWEQTGEARENPSRYGRLWELHIGSGSHQESTVFSSMLLQALLFKDLLYHTLYHCETSFCHSHVLKSIHDDTGT